MQLAFSLLIYSIVLGCVLSAAGVLLVKLLKMKCCRFLMHFSWVFMSILMIFTFLFVAILRPVSVVSLEFCEIYNGLITVEADLDLYPDYVKDDLKENWKFCVFGGSDMAVKYNIKDQLSTINTVTDKFDEIKCLTTPGCATYIDVAGSATSITTLKT